MRGGARRANLESTSRAKRSKQLSYELLHVRQADVRARLFDGLVAFDDGLSLDQVRAGDARHAFGAAAGCAARGLGAARGAASWIVEHNTKWE